MRQDVLDLITRGATTFPREDLTAALDALGRECVGYVDALTQASAKERFTPDLLFSSFGLGVNALVLLSCVAGMQPGALSVIENALVAKEREARKGETDGQN